MKILLTIFLLIPTLLYASNDSKVSITKLDNGLTVLVQPTASSQSVAIYAFVKTGSTLEHGCIGCGLSHYVEHMLFKGTSRRKVGEIAKEVKSLGGVINAHTSFDETVYTLDVPATNWKQGMDLIADMLMNATFDAAEAQRERTVIHGEMRLYEDQPARKLSELVFKNVYLYHPYRHPIIGYKPLFDAVTRDQLYSYYKQRYTPNNIILSVAGNVDEDAVIQFAKDLYKDFKPQPFVDHNIPQEPGVVSKRSYVEEFATDVYRYSYSFHSVGLLNEDLYALDFLAQALGDGESSVLFKTLYKQHRLVETVVASNFTPLNKGVFEIEFMMKKNDLEEVIKLINEQIEIIKLKGLKPVDLVRIKKQLRVDFMMGNQRASQFAYRNAQDYAYTGDVRFSQKYLDGLSRITNEDVKRVAQKYLNPSKSILVGLVPKGSVPKNKEEKNLKQDNVELLTYPNGLNVILNHDPSVGVFSINAAIRGGIREETIGNNGLQRLFVNNWDQSTRRWPNQSLRQYLEKEGLYLGALLGKNSFGLNLSGIADDSSKALDVMVDLLRYPDFNQKTLKEKKEDLIVSFKTRMDDIYTVTFLALYKEFFNQHPYGLDEFGTPEKIQSYTLADLKDMHKRFIVPSNTVISISGNFNIVDMKEQIHKNLENWQAPQLQLTEDVQFVSPDPRVVYVDLEKEQAMISWAFKAPSMYSEDRYAMELLDRMLGGGLGGRIFNKVREEFGQAYTMGSSYMPGIDVGMFSIYVLTTPDKVSAVKDIVENELRDIRNKSITSEELQSLKNFLKGRQQMSLDTPAAIGGTMVIDQLFGFGYDYYLKYPERIDSLTLEQINKTAIDYLDPKQAVVVITKAKKSVE